MNAAVKQKNKEKIVFLNKCRKQFLQLNKGLDHKKKWEIYKRVKNHVKMPKQFKIVKNKESMPNINDLPDKFCVKGNLGEQGREILLIEKKKKGRFYDRFHQKTYCKHTLSDKWNRMLNRNKLLIFEEWLLDRTQGNIPFDYKIHVLNGTIFSIYAFDRNNKNKTITIFDKDWNVITSNRYFVKPVTGYRFDSIDPNIMKPDNAERQKLTDTAIGLWHLFHKPHLTRFDMYIINGNIYFGEVTLMCGALKMGVLTTTIINKLMKKTPWK